MSIRVRLWTFTFVVLALLATAISCAVNPATGRREFSLVSASQELQIGQDGYGAIRQEYGLYDDPQIAAYVDSVGQRLAGTSQLPNLEWKFTVLDDPVVNAFAMPGGYIYITRGILTHLENEAQLAGVLGHEIGHVTARHTAQRMTYQQLAGLGLGLASVFSETFRTYSATAEQALGLMFLKYGRDDENQADALGVTYATAGGWDPREIPGTYTMLGRLSAQSGQRLPVFLSTHPDPGDRQQRTTALSTEAARGRTGLQVRERAYLERIDGVVYGEDPRQGYFEGAQFYHPEMGIEAAFPAGWTTQNSRAAVLAQDPGKTGTMQLGLANAPNLSPEAFVAQLRSGGKVAGAEGRRETIGGYQAWVGRLLVPGEQQGTTQTLLAAFVRQTPDRMLQFIGQASQPAASDAFYACVRSLRPLSDARRAHPTPARLRVRPSPAAGDFGAVIPRVGTSEVGPDELAIINQVELDEGVLTGQLLKTVEPARKH